MADDAGNGLGLRRAESLVGIDYRGYIDFESREISSLIDINFKDIDDIEAA